MAAKLEHGKTTAGGSSGGSELQGPAVHRRDDPLGSPLVPDVPISYRDLEPMLADRGLTIAHITIFRWIQAYAPELEKRIRPQLRLFNGSWRVDETYVRVKGRWSSLYCAIYNRGQTIDFLLSAKRDTAAAKRFFRKALGQLHTLNPHIITVDKSPACPRAVAEL
jgi:IS6 family transposase